MSTSIVGDSSFAALELLDAVSKRPLPIHLITRLRLDAALYEPVAPRHPSTMGRPRLKGKRLPNLSQLLIDPNTEWSKITVNRWYGEGERAVEVCTGVAVWYRAWITCSTYALGVST